MHTRRRKSTFIILFLPTSDFWDIRINLYHIFKFFLSSRKTHGCFQMKMRFLMEWQTLKPKVRQYSQETQNRNIKNWPQGLAAVVWKPSNKPGNSTGLQYTLIRLCGLPEVTQGFSKSKAWCKSAWIGTNQAASLMLAAHTLPSQHLTPITAVLWDTLCFSSGLQNALQSFTRKRHFPYFSYFNTQVQAQTNLGEHSPEKQAGNAGQEHDF